MILVTHVPKCVGTSLGDCLIKGLNLNRERDVYKVNSNYRGMWNVIKSHPDQFVFLKGHYPYGVHWFFRPATMARRAPKIFIATLRDPIDQMISFYYYHRMIKNQSPYKNGICKQSLVDFFQLNPQACNMQTYMYAGLPFSKLSMNNRIWNRSLVNIAIYNLKFNYHYIVHHSFLNASINNLSKGLGIDLKLEHNQLTVVKNRPKVDEIPLEERASLQRLSTMDVELHNRLKQWFESVLGLTA